MKTDGKKGTNARIKYKVSGTYARKTDLAITALGALASLGNILSSVTATCYFEHKSSQHFVAVKN